MFATMTPLQWFILTPLMQMGVAAMLVVAMRTYVKPWKFFAAVLSWIAFCSWLLWLTGYFHGKWMPEPEPAEVKGVTRATTERPTGVRGDGGLAPGVSDCVCVAVAPSQRRDAPRATPKPDVLPRPLTHPVPTDYSRRLGLRRFRP